MKNADLHSPCLEGKRIILRPVDEEHDFPILYSWRNNVSDLFLWTVHKDIISPQAFPGELKREKRHIQMMITTKNSDSKKIVGTVFSFDFNPIDETIFLQFILRQNTKEIFMELKQHYFLLIICLLILISEKFALIFTNTISFPGKASKKPDFKRKEFLSSKNIMTVNTGIFIVMHCSERLCQ